MKSRSGLAIVIVLCACLTAALPVVTAIVLTRHQASEREESYVERLAQVALASSEATSDQLIAANQAINAFPKGASCAAPTLDIMRSIDLSSSLLQAVGRLDGNRVLCASIDMHGPVDLGRPDAISATGARIWTNVKLFGSNQSYLAIGKGAFVGIIHKDLPLSFVDLNPGSAVGTFNWSHRVPLVTRGPFDPHWMKTDQAGPVVFWSNGYLVSVAKSKRYDQGTVAAVPVGQIVHFTYEAAIILVPIGLLAGALLSVFMLRLVRNRASLPAMIRNGLRCDEFHLLYQPVVNLRTGRTVGAEALMRWQKGDGEMVSPDCFIAVAEQAGSIRLLTARVMELLARDAGQLMHEAPQFHIAVNFAAADIHSPGIVGDVERFVRQAGLRFDNLIIEVTERSLVDVALAASTIGRLRALGIKVAIDDFGTGYSGLGYLAQLEVDYLKIDKLFVQALGTGSATSQVVGRIIQMAKDLKLAIVAEGVEEAEQERRLRTLGVEYAQGYRLGRPMTVVDLLQRMEQERKQTSKVRRSRTAADRKAA